MASKAKDTNSVHDNPLMLPRLDIPVLCLRVRSLTTPSSNIAGGYDSPALAINFRPESNIYRS